MDVVPSPRKIVRIGTLLEDSGHDGPDVPRLPMRAQRRESLVDRFADQIRQRDPALAQPLGFPEALFIESHVHQPRAHPVKIARLYVAGPTPFVLLTFAPFRVGSMERSAP